MPNTFDIEPVLYLESHDTMYAVVAQGANVCDAMAFCRKRIHAECVQRLLNADARRVDTFVVVTVGDREKAGEA